MNPTTTAVHYPQILQNLSIRHKNGEFIGDMIAPVIPVSFASDYYYEFSKADDLRDTADYRAPGTSSNRDGFTLSQTQYSCKEIAQSTQLEDETKANADAILNLEMAKTRFVTNKIMLKHEVLTESKLMTTGNWTSSNTPTIKWNNYDSSDPLTDLRTAFTTIKGYCPYGANTMVLGYDVWECMKYHPVLVGRLSNDTTRILTIDNLKYMFGVDKVLIGMASKNTSRRGVTASYSDIWTKDIWIGYVNPTPGIEEPSALYTFSWDYSNSRNNEPMGIRGVRKWRDENIHSWIIEAYQSLDQKITGADYGYVLEAVID